MWRLIVSGYMVALCCSVMAKEPEIKRLVSIDGSITEIVYALQGDPLLVGVDSTSRYPQQATELPSVGYLRHLSAEGILSLFPDTVITTQDAGPDDVMAHLSRAGVKVHQIHSEPSVDSVIEKIIRVSSLIDQKEQGARLISALENRLQILEQRLDTVENFRPPQVMLLLAAGAHGVMIAGAGTQGDVLINALRGENIGKGFTSYKPLTPEGALSLDPEVIIIAETVPGSFSLEQYPYLKQTSAALSDRVLVEDSLLLLGFGPRIVDALQRLYPYFYPDRPDVRRVALQ